MFTRHCQKKDCLNYSGNFAFRLRIPEKAVMDQLFISKQKIKPNWHKNDHPASGVAEGRLLNCRNQADDQGNESPKPLPHLFRKFPASVRDSARLTQVADPLVPNRICQNLKTWRKSHGGRDLESRACKSLSRRRFREFEDGAALASFILGIRAGTREGSLRITAEGSCLSHD